MPKYSKEIIKILGIIFVVYGGVKILLGLRGAGWTFSPSFYPSEYFTMLETVFHISVELLLKIFLPLGAIISGVGLLKKTKWGWNLSVITASVAFIISAFGSIYILVTYYRYRNIPMPPIPEGVVEVISVSMIPTYIQSIVTLIILILLFQKFIKQSFS